jgi:Mor family transcriptional regulator
MSDYPEILTDLREIIAAIALEEGVASELANKIAYTATEKIRRDWGGIPTYIPKGVKHENSRRDIEIFKKFTGHNHSALCREYGLTLPRIYDIIKNQKKIGLKEIQVDMFNIKAL